MPKTDHRLPRLLCAATDRPQIAMPTPCTHRQTTDCLSCSVHPQTDHRLPCLLRAPTDRPQIATPALYTHRQTTDCHAYSVHPQTDHRSPCLLQTPSGGRPQVTKPALYTHRQTTDCHACSVHPQTDHRLPSLLRAPTDRPQAQYRSRVPWRHWPLVTGCACMGLGVWRDGTNCAPLSEVPWCGVMTDS